MNMKSILATVTVCLFAWFNSIAVNGQREITENSSSKFVFIQNETLPSPEVFGRRLDNQSNRLVRQLGGANGGRVPSSRSATLKRRRFVPGFVVTG